MGQNNRQRRAAKQRQRTRNQRDRRTSDFVPDDGDPEFTAARIAVQLLGRWLLWLVRGVDRTIDRQEFQRCAPRHQQAAVDAQFTSAVDRLIETGWTPLDIYEVVRRKTTSAGITHLLDLVATATARHADPLINPQWQAQLDGLGAVSRSTGRSSPASGWGDRSGLDWPSALEELVAVLTVIAPLPVVAAVLPPPGASHEAPSAAGGIDARVLRRVRGLLAKAESTEHEEEADALTAKAQELMTRYSIERAVAEAAEPAGPTPISRRLWLESPYVHAKALLVKAVADANNCRTVHSFLGFVAIIGHAADADVVELLTMSLLVQATRAMTMAGPQVTRAGTSRTRSFRQSFLVAYAGRIGERLRESAHTTETTYDADHGGQLVPVLSARREAVADKLTDLYPHLVERRVSVSHEAGWHAGRAAADLARFDVHGALTRAG